VPPTLNPSRTTSKAARALWAFTGLVAILGATLVTGSWWIHRSIAPLSGRIPLTGLTRPVEVRFDAFAVPHVFAGSDADAWRAVGFLQARDRLWQMDLYRRAASGRLSELLGEATIAVDQRFLTLGLRRAAEQEWQQTSEDVRAAFTHYAEGVNTAMSVPRGALPLEHQLLGVVPERWTPVDSLAISKLFAWRLAENHRAELLRYLLVEAVGPRALELFPAPPEWAPTVVDTAGIGRLADWQIGGFQRPSNQSGTLPIRQSADQGFSQSANLPIRQSANVLPGLEWLYDSRAMSNAWVVHGSRTATGRPLLASDPHLNVEMPSVWWEVHVVSDALDVAGTTIPGIPFVVIGHNRDIGWGLTNVGTDVQDFFVERLDAERQRYQLGDEWLPLDTRRQEIRVRGRDQPVVFEVRSTRHGPVLSPESWRDLQPGDPPDTRPLPEIVLALKWSVVEKPGSAAAFDRLARTKNWQEFLTAVRQFPAPAQNFVYADTNGNIGFAVSGLVPARKGADGSLPVPGWPIDSDWSGFIDVGRLPALFNPPSGQIATSNNQVDRSLDYVVTRDWVAPFRAQRVGALLDAHEGLDTAAMQRIHADITSLSADHLLKHTEVPEAVAELRGWDRLVDGRPVSLLYQAFEAALWQRTFADEFPPALYEHFYRYAANERFAGLHAIIADPRSPWFDDRTTPGVVESREAIARAAADDALKGLRARFGAPTSWRWDAVHAVKYPHVLGGGGRMLDWFFSRGPVPVNGDGMTVNKTTTNLRRPYGTSEAASYRQILDIGMWDASLAVNTTGQSGHPRSPHYFDQNELWRQTRYRPLPFTRAAVERATVSRLELVP
jgi:penicillin G amidase